MDHPNIQELKTIVTLQRVFHRGEHCIALFFKWDTTLVEKVKAMPGRKYSKTMKCWYFVERDGLIDLIVDTLKDSVKINIDAVIDRHTGASNQENSIHEKKKVELVVLPRPVSAYREQALLAMERKLKLKGYSINTQRTYLQHFKDFLQFYPDSDPMDLNEEEIRHYLLYLVEKKKLSRSSQNTAINAIKFFYEKVLKQERKVYYLDRPLKEHRLPEVLSQEDIMIMFEAIDNLKHRLMLMIIYAAGLRRSELLNLRVGDVDINRNMIFIKGGKGRKDRQTVMAKSLVPMLQAYLEQYKPGYWLFEGQAGEQYSTTSLQVILKRAASNAGITKRVRLHMLRHSFATHMLEAGTATRYIQVLLGHESPKTTEIYAQVTRFGLDKVVSPLDQIAESKRLRGDEAE